MRLIIPALAILFLAACTTRSPYIGSGAIKVIYRNDLPGNANALWDRDNLIIYVSGNAGPAWLAHEGLHAAESLNLPLSQVLDLVGPLPGYERDVALARQVASEGGDWYALYRLAGPAAVRHPEILASIRLQKALRKK